MELFTRLFGPLLVFAYHCFDRIVVHGYLTGLSRPEHVVHFFREVIGVPVITKEILRERTQHYQNWVEAFARNHRLPIEWDETGVRKEDYVRRWQRRVVRNNTYAVCILFSRAWRSAPPSASRCPNMPPRTPITALSLTSAAALLTTTSTCDEVLGPLVLCVGSFFPFKAAYYLNGHSFIEQQLKRAKIGFRKDDNAFLAVTDVAALQAAGDQLSPEIIRRQLDYWTFVLGPKFSARERRQLRLSRIYAISQVEYCLNFVFKRNFPIHKLFERSCELGLWRLTAHKIAEVFGLRLQRNHRGKLATVIDQIEHGHHVFRAYFRNAVLRQYEKFSMFLRNELCSNNLYDFGLKKGLDHLDEVRHKFHGIVSRFAAFQAQWLNVHTDFPLLQKIALPTTVGSVRYPGIKIHDTRIIRLRHPARRLDRPRHPPGCPHDIRSLGGRLRPQPTGLPAEEN